MGRWVEAYVLCHPLEKTNVWHLEGIRDVLRIEGHDDISFRFVADPGSATLDTNQKASLGFEIANAMLRDMNWVD